MHKLIYPNLPDSNVGLVVVKEDKITLSALKNLGIEALSPVKNPLLQEEISEHSDMLFFYGGNGVCLVSPEQTELAESLTALGFSVKLSQEIFSPYPNDVKLNFALCKDKLTGNFGYADNSLRDLLSDGVKRINVKQGYAKCSLCIVNENAFITEDRGIARALRESGAKVLEISSGDVYLSHRHFGFFGGATGKLSKNRLAINGNLKYHRDGEKIRGFLAEENVLPVELFDGKITDIGGIIPLATLD